MPYDTQDLRTCSYKPRSAFSAFAATNNATKVRRVARGWCRRRATPRTFSCAASPRLCNDVKFVGATLKQAIGMPLKARKAALRCLSWNPVTFLVLERARRTGKARSATAAGLVVADSDCNGRLDLPTAAVRQGDSHHVETGVQRNGCTNGTVRSRRRWGDIGTPEYAVALLCAGGSDLDGEVGRTSARWQPGATRYVDRSLAT